MATPEENIPVLLGDLNADNQCVLNVSLLADDGRKSRPLKAIIDTGSAYSFVSPSAVDPSLAPSGKTFKFKPIGGLPQSSDVYNCRMVIHSLNTAVDFEFLVNKDLFNDIDIIIGSIVLANFVFKYNYPIEGSFYLAPLIQPTI